MGRNNLIFGMHPLLEALEAGREIDKILLKRGLRSDEVSRIMALARERIIPLQMVPEERLSRLTRGQHQGVIAFVSEIEYTSLEHDLRAGTIPVRGVAGRLDRREELRGDSTYRRVRWRRCPHHPRAWECECDSRRHQDLGRRSTPLARMSCQLHRLRSSTTATEWAPGGRSLREGE